jgi:2,4-dienoyl-CoA reductase-like NADH-dependent reductase (Old Yellow Enzyme family)
MLTHIDKPIRIRNLQLKNRVVRTTTTSNLGGGTVTEDLIAYHEARARAGVGLSVLDVMSVHPSCYGPLYALHPKMDELYPPMIRRLKAHGMAVFQQLWHGGNNTVSFDGSPPWAVSDLPGPTVGIVPITMTKAMIKELTTSFAEAARRCEAWGVDGVEFLAAHGYLAAQFLSLSTNKREDEYGGPLENRIRFTVETINAMRAAVSDNFIIGVRVGDDMALGGARHEDYLALVKALEGANLIDYVSITNGGYYALDAVAAGMEQPAGVELPTSVPITRNVTSPTIVVGRFRTLEEADQVIRAGDADMVGLARAHIADPDLVRKTLEGHPEQVRPCIACNQGCIGGLNGPFHRLGCVVNPAVGFETSLSEDKLPRPAVPRKVLVIGGGPAGMEAARVAALRGHKVVLAEAGPTLGGQLKLAAKAPARRGIFDIAAWQEQEIYRHGVDVRLSTYMDVEDVIGEGADAVILATGSTPRMDGLQISNPAEPIEGFERPNVLSSHDLFLNPPRTGGGNALVIDDAGHYEGISAADQLIALGFSVTFITRHAAFAPGVEPSLTTTPALQRLTRGGCAMLTRTRAISIDDDGVVIGPIYMPREGPHVTRVPADLVVFVSMNRANRDLLEQLSARGVAASAIGDARSPRYLQAAIREGYLEGAAV